MAKEYLVVTIIGPDRRGLVAEITEEIVTQQANIEESHMARLGGEFAVIMLLSIASKHKTALLQGLDKINGESIKVFAKETDLSRLKVFAGFVPYQISVIGADHEGIVHHVAEYLAELRIQVDEMETQVTKAPVTGARLFSMEAEIQAPPELTLKTLREKLEAVEDKFSVDIDVKLPID